MSDDDKSRMKMSDRHQVEQQLLAELREYLDELEARSPVWDDGEECAIEIRGARSAYTVDDYPLYSFAIKRRSESIL